MWDLNRQACVRVIYSSHWSELPSRALFRSYYREAGRVTCLRAFEKRIDVKIECLFAAGTSRGFLGIWMASNGSCIKEFRNFDSGKIFSLELRSNDELVCSSESNVHLISLSTFKQFFLKESRYCAGYGGVEAKYGFEITEQIRKITTAWNDFAYRGNRLLPRTSQIIDFGLFYGR